MIKLLITSSGGPLVPALTKFLKNDHQLEKIYIVGIDRKKIKKIPYVDKLYFVKDNKKNQYLSKVLKICKKEKINVLIPHSDNEARVISKFKKRFTNLGVKVLVNNKKIIDVISNKYLTYKVLKTNGIQVPKFKLAKNVIELKKALIYFNYPKYPIIIKPVQGIGGRGVVILNGKKKKLQKWIGNGKRENVFQKEMKIFSKKIFDYGPVIVMEPLSSPAYDVDCLVFKQKQLIVIRRRINPSGIPYKGNYIIKDKKIKNYCKKIIRVLKIKYLVDLDLLTSKNGKPLLLEVNPRPSGSAVLAHFANIPIFSYAIAKILNKKYNIKFSKNMINKKINFLPLQ